MGRPTGGGGTPRWVRKAKWRVRACRSRGGRRAHPSSGGCARSPLQEGAVRSDAMAQPGGTPVIGPFPPGVEGDDAQEEYDKLRRRLLWSVPSGLYVIGSTDKAERRNGMTLNWLTQVSFDPKWMGIGVDQSAFTHELVSASGVFSICLIDREDRAIVRKFTKPVDV